MHPTSSLCRRESAANRRQHRSLHLQLEALESRCLLSSGLASYGQLPLSFAPNVGEAAAAADFVTGDGALTLTHGGFDVVVASPPASPNLGPTETAAVTLRLLGANSAAKGEAVGRLPGVSNYLIGNDPTKWHVNVPTYGGVDYANVYPGIDLNYHGEQGQLEYDFVVRSGAYAGTISLQVQGAQSWSLDASGNLVLHTAAGDVVQKAPVAYQEINGVRRDVAARFVLRDHGTVGFAVGAHNPALPLTIDPVLTYSTYLGGSDADYGIAIAVDSAGSAYATGDTLSTNFPTVNPFETAVGAYDVFVAKLNPAGNALVYSTYLGGSSFDFVNGIAVDATGNAYIAGDTNSNDFPAVGGFQGSLAGSYDAFVAKLNAAGNGLVYATYLGGSDFDAATSIALDSSDNAYVTGFTQSTNFPTLGAFQAMSGGGTADAFVAKMNAAGNALVYSTYLGGSGEDHANRIAVDGSGNAFVAGYTKSTDFPIANPHQSQNQGGVTDGTGFVAKLNRTGNGLIYSTYLDFSGEQANALAVDGSGNAYVGTAISHPDVPFPYVVVYKLTPAGNALVYRAQSDAESVNGLALDSAGDAYLTGECGANFSTVNPFQSTEGGGADAYVAELNPAGSKFLNASYLGGGGEDVGNGIALDPSGNVYVVGNTASTDFPTRGALQAHYAGGADDAFVAKVSSTLSAAWRGADVAVGSDGKTKLLWDTADGRADVWSVGSNFAVAGGPAYGPIPGWLAVDSAAGADGLTRVLWRNSTTGAAALWLMDAGGNLVNEGVFGPFAGWTPQDVTVAPDNVARILWTNTSGQAVIWRVDNNLNVTSSAVFGPFSGWSATRLTAGSDSLLRLIWTQANGTAALWLLNADGTYHSSTVFGPIAGWTVTDVTVGSDDNTRILWTSTSSAMAIWTMSNSFSVLRSSVYGPISGWMAEAIAAGSDGELRVLWDNTNGAAALWLLGNDGTFQAAATYGPF
jgi:hypothetical protein